MGAKQRNKKYVLDKAKEVFLKNGISGVSMADIAKEADFGVASVYRYFGSRRSLILECAVSLWGEKREKLYEEYAKNLNLSGFDQITALTKYFAKLVVSDKEFARFLLSLDTYLASDVPSQAEREEYDAILLEIYSMFESAYKCGLNDGSIRDVGSFQDFYYAATQSLISLSQRLTMRGNADSDEKSLSDKINLLINMFTTYVLNKK